MGKPGETEKGTPLATRMIFVDQHANFLERNNKWTQMDTVRWMQENMPGLLPDDLGRKRVNKWVVNMAKRRATAEKKAAAAKVPKKSGPKQRPVPPGELAGAWKNMKASLVVLTLCASLIMTQVRAGVPLNLVIISSLVIGVLRANDNLWLPSRSFLRTFVVERMGLRWRQATRDVRHAPRQLAEITKLFILRFVWLVHVYKVPPSMCFNLDETGVYLFPLPKQTYAPLGEKQVDVIDFDSKTQFTATPVISADGTFVGTVQVIWAGAPGQTGACPQR